MPMGEYIHFRPEMGMSSHKGTTRPFPGAFMGMFMGPLIFFNLFFSQVRPRPGPFLPIVAELAPGPTEGGGGAAPKTAQLRALQAHQRHVVHIAHHKHKGFVV